MFRNSLKIKVPPLRELLKKKTIKHYFGKFLGLRATPHNLAWSVAIGVFIGFLIPIGFQTFFIIPLAAVLEVNLIVAYLSTLVSNPITAIPMYYVAVELGKSITGINVAWSNFEILFSAPSWDALMNLGSESIIVFFTGSFILGVIFAILLYFTTLKLVTYYRKIHNIQLN